MPPNPLLKKLGFANDDRLVIFHADDVGMCQASLAAYADLVDSGLVLAASTMVPCPWFPAVAAFCRDYEADNLDLGVHLTLTSEFEAYRWGPISTRDPSSGLIDSQGYFHAQTGAVFDHGEPDAVQREIQAQVQRALDVGIDVTHIDTHMGSVVHPKFIPAYLQLALQHCVPPLLLRKDETGLQELGIDPEVAALFVREIRTLEAGGLPMLDDFVEMPLDQPENRLEQVKAVLSALPPGITYLVFHPARDTPELRAIAPDWRSRVADYRVLASEDLRAFVKSAGVHVIGWRVLRDLLRDGS